MLASNQPMGRVTQEDGLVNGFLIGGAMGASQVGAMHLASKHKAARPLIDQFKGSMKEGLVSAGASEKQIKAVKGMGGWKGKAAAYAGASLLGGIGGAVVDSFQDHYK